MRSKRVETVRGCKTNGEILNPYGLSFYANAVFNNCSQPFPVMLPMGMNTPQVKHYDDAEE
jgi:hypothetical protein